MLGESVKRLREEKGWTRSELAVEADLELDSITAIESSGARAEPNVVARLARALDVLPGVLTTQWGSVPGEGRFRDLLAPLVEYIPSPSGMDAFRVDRAFDKLSAEIVEVFARGGMMRTSNLDSIAATLAELQAAPIVQNRARALSTFARGLIVAVEGASPDEPPASARRHAHILVAAALDDSMSESDFRALFEKTAYLLAGWFVHRRDAYAACVRGFALERTELEYAALEGRRTPFNDSRRQQLVSGLTSILGSLLIASALTPV